MIAATPFGQALTIQNSEIAPTANRTRNALTNAGIQSATCKCARPLHADNVAGVDHAGEAVESAGHAEHAGGGVVREQPLHRRFSVEARQRSHRRAARPAQFRRLLGRLDRMRREPRPREEVVNGVGLARGRSQSPFSAIANATLRQAEIVSIRPDTARCSTAER